MHARTFRKLLVPVFFLLAVKSASGAVILMYNPNDGNVQLDTNSLSIARFTLQNEPDDSLIFDTGETDFSDLPVPLFPPDNTATEIDWIAQDLANGFDGVANLGNIFPTELSLSEVEDFTNIAGTDPPQGRSFDLAPVPPGGGGSMRVVLVPEPSSSSLLLCLLVAGVTGRQWRSRKLAKTV